MSDPFDGKQFPKGVLYGAAVLVGFVMVMTFGAQRTDTGTVHVPDADVAYAVTVRFVDRGPDGLEVRAASNAELITRVQSGEDGFVRGVLRGLNRTRKLEGLGPEAPFRLIRWSDGRLSLLDPVTGHRVELRGFGDTNLEAFARLVEAAEDNGGG